MQVVALVQTQMGRLDLTATQFFSDVDVKALREGARGGLDIVAPTRVRIGERLQESATETRDELAELASEASDATQTLVELADSALGALADCGTEAGEAWSSVLEGGVDVTAMQQAKGTCESAREEYAQAEAELAELPDAPAQSTTGEGAAAGEEVRVVLGTSGTQTNEVVQPVAPGASVHIVLDGQNTSSFEWRLQKACDGPLTFEVTMLVSADGTPAVDPAEAGYVGSGSAVKQKVPAVIKGNERFELDVGTFTIREEASGSTRIVVMVGNNLCPDSQTGSLYTPMSIGPSPSDALVLEVG